MKQISHSDLDSMMRDFLEFEGEPKSGLARLHALSYQVLLTLLGFEWVRDNVLQGHPQDGYLASGCEASEDRYKHLDRTVSLAEMLFNFQNVSGIANRMNDLRTCSVETAIAELEGAKFLYRAGIPFEFVVPVRKKGKDFDIKIGRDSGQVINCEMKSKIIKTDLSYATTLGTLNKARHQLPPGEPALVFMKIPEHWVKSSACEGTIKDATEDFFRNTSRVAALIFHWEEWHASVSNPEARTRIVLCRQVVNNRSQFRSVVESFCLIPISAPWQSDSWTYFANLFDSEVHIRTR